MSSPTRALAVRVKESIAKLAGGSKRTAVVLGGSAEDARLFSEVFEDCDDTSLVVNTSPVRRA